MINLYDSKETDFKHNGLLVLSDCKSAPITEESNGQYEIELEYPLDKRNKWQHLLEGNIIKADGQLFRIYRKIKTLDGIKVNARHIFYDLLDNFLEDVMCASITGYGALDHILRNAQYPHLFTSAGDVGGTKTKEFLQVNPVEAIMGAEGILNIWGGELIRDNFNIKILGQRGLDRGVLVSYGKNIQGIEETLDMDFLCTRIYPVVTLDNGYVLTLPEKYVDSPLIDNYHNPKVKGVEFKKEELSTEDVVTSEVSDLIALADIAKVASSVGIKESEISIANIASISGEVNLTPAEKIIAQVEWNKIKAEKPIIDAKIAKYFKTSTGNYATLDELTTAHPQGNATIYRIAQDSKWYSWNGWSWSETPITTDIVTTYNIHYNSLINNYIPYLLTSMTTTSIIICESFKIYFNNYFNAREAILSTIATKAMEEYNVAQADANRANYVVELRVLTTAYFGKSKCDIPQVNYKIDFLELSKTEEYKNYAVLERVYMSDTITVKHTKLNIDIKTKVIKTTKNPLTNRIDKIELGSFKPNLASTTSKAIQEIKNDVEIITSDYQDAIDNATSLITGASGGNVVIRGDSNKKPYEILIMDTDNIMTATNVWRWNIGGFGYSSTGVNGPFATAITMDGHIVAEFITALTISGQMIKAGIIQSHNGNWQMNLDNENFNLGDKLMFDGDKLTFGNDVTLSWNQITGTEDIPLRDDLIWENIGGVPTDLLTQDELVVALGNYITTGVMNNALKDTLNTTNFKTIITKDFIASMNLVVGQQISMGSNAVITWSNLSYESQTNLTGSDGYSPIKGLDYRDGYDGYTPRKGVDYWDGINGIDGTDGTDVDYWVVKSIIGEDYIVTGLIACDRITTPYGHSPVITLFNSASLDANSGGIRLRYNSGYYINVTGNGIGFYLGTGNAENYIISSGATFTGLTVTGAKACLQSTDNYGDKMITAYETAEYYFGDIGGGTIGEDGECVINIDEIFQECVNMNITYHVFTQTYHGHIDTIDRQVGYFVIKGEVGTEFSWELKAKRKGYEHQRLETVVPSYDYEQTEIETELEYNQELENSLLEE